VIRSWGLLNESAYPDDPSRQGIPHPGFFIISRDGIVAEKHFEESFRERHSASRLVIGPTEIPGGAIEIASDTFTLRTYPSNPEVFPGNEIGLVLDFELGEDLHAYAPGDHSYRALDVTMEPSELVRFGALTLPETKPFVFAPLEETVPVFDGKFRVVQNATLLVNELVRAMTGAEDRTIELRGTLSYQVCSSEICYPPAQAAVRWRFDVRPLETERVPEDLRKK